MDTTNTVTKDKAARSRTGILLLGAVYAMIMGMLVTIGVYGVAAGLFTIFIALIAIEIIEVIGESRS